MIKLKNILTENSPGYTGRKFGESLPTLKGVMEKHKIEETPLAPPHDFDKPTVVHISKDELITLYKTGTLETDGLTIIYGD